MNEAQKTINERTNRNKKYFAIYLVIILLIGSFVVGLYVGRGKNIISGSDDNGQTLEGQNSSKTSKVDFQLFWDVWNLVEEDFIKDVDYQKMLYGAISGMISSLEDPYTSFMDPEVSSSFRDEIEGTFDGIGAEIGIKNEQLTIIAPLPSSPAEVAGIKSKDRILKINDEDTSSMNLFEAVSKIRGEKGSVVKLNIIRDGFEEPKDIEITRDTIAVESVKWSIKEKDGKNIAYLELAYFGENTSKDFKNAVTEMLAKNVDGLIIDLRNNTGGYLQSSIEISGEMLQKGQVVTIESFSDGKKNEFKASNGSRIANLKTVVLVNGGTASASEIVSGALRDHREVKLIGEKTFGKGTVQELKELDDGSSLRLSIAEWLTPNGTSINHEGLHPDIEVELTEEDYNKDRDPQLDKALEVVISEIGE